MIHTPILKFVIVNLFTTVEAKPTPVLLVTANCEPSCPVVGRDELDKLTPLFKNSEPLQLTTPGVSVKGVLVVFEGVITTKLISVDAGEATAVFEFWIFNIFEVCVIVAVYNVDNVSNRLKVGI